MKRIKTQVIRGFLFGLGIFSLVVGIIGLFLPLLPTTPFVLLAAWCFLNSSPRFHAYLYQNRYLGPILKNWEERRAISRKAKIQALSLMAVSIAVIWWRVEVIELRVGVSVFLIAVATFLWTRPE